MTRKKNIFILPLGILFIIVKFQIMFAAGDSELDVKYLISYPSVTFDFQLVHNNPKL